ncbi:MAG: tetratricopeptide repeat protein, partial [Pleurocapsa sp.]
MNKLYKILRSIRRTVWLGLLTLLLITAIPAVAVEKPQTATIDVSRLLIKGKTAFDLGKFSEAAKYWQLAQHEYKSKGDRPRQALSLNYLSLANQELGQWDMADSYIDQSLQLLDKSPANTRVLAQVLNTQGSLLLAEGKGKQALASWQEAEAIYSKANDPIGVIGSKINQAQALQHLGLYRRSQKILEGLKTQLNQESDPRLRVIGLRSLGNALQVSGDLSEAQAVLEQSLTLAQKANSAEETSAILFSLGNTAQGLKSYEAAIAFYEQTAKTTANPINKAEAQLNQLSLLTRLGRFQAAQEIIPEIQSHLNGLSSSRRSIYAQVNLAKNLIDLEQKNGGFDEYFPYTQKLLLTTVNQAQDLRDVRAESYSLGTLGHFYEQNEQLAIAEKSTTKALNLANRINATDITYQWQWQLGRLLQQQGDIQGAIAAETGAVNSLQTIRGDLVATNLDAQYSFRESVEPIYRDLVSLLLDHNPSQNNLVQSREVLESLQLAELENYFRVACIDAQPKQIDQVDEHAGVIYPIILSDRLGVIVSLPGQPLSYHENIVDRAEVEKTLSKLFQSLNPVFSNKRRMKYSQQVYDWLIKPAEAKLETQD